MQLASHNTLNPECRLTKDHVTGSAQRVWWLHAVQGLHVLFIELAGRYLPLFSTMTPKRYIPPSHSSRGSAGPQFAQGAPKAERGSEPGSPGISAKSSSPRHILNSAIGSAKPRLKRCMSQLAIIFLFFPLLLLVANFLLCRPAVRMEQSRSKINN